MMKDLLRTAMILTMTQQKRCESYHLRITHDTATIFITGGLCGHSNAARDECERVSAAWRRSDKGM